MAIRTIVVCPDCGGEMVELLRTSKMTDCFLCTSCRVVFGAADAKFTCRNDDEVPF